MKRIAFLGRGVHTIPSYRRMLNSLSDNFEITVFCETPLDGSWRKPERKYKLISWCAGGLPSRVNALLFSLSVVVHHIARKYDVIHAHSTYPTGLIAVILQRLFSVSGVVSLDGGEGVDFASIEFGDLHSRRRTRLNKWVLNRARIVTTLTDFHREAVIENLGIDRSIVVIPRGADESIFYSKDVLRIQTPVRFISVGYLSPIKDPETLLRTFHLIHKEIPSFLTIVGRDYMNGEIQKLASELRLDGHVQFIDQIDYCKVPAMYAQADVLLHTSLYESQGMVVAEALACGLLVCGSDVGLIHDLGDECCVRAPVGDFKILAERVVRLLGDGNRISVLRRNANTWSRNYSLKKTVSRWSDVYTALIEKRS